MISILPNSSESGLVGKLVDLEVDIILEEAGAGMCCIFVVLILLNDLLGAVGILYHFDDLAFSEKVAIDNSIFLCS